MSDGKGCTCMAHSEPECACGADWTSQIVYDQQAEIERLRKALRYEENRFARIGTHGHDCYTWGPSHYECAMREIERLRELNRQQYEEWETISRQLAESQAREAKLRDFIFDYTDLEPNNERMIARYDSCVKPADDTTLKAALKAERGVVLKEIIDLATRLSCHGMNQSVSLMQFQSAIRAMEE